jgi:hypothetical protein
MTDTMQPTQSISTGHGWRNAFVILNALIICGVAFWLGTALNSAPESVSEPGTVEGLVTLIILGVGGVAAMIANVVLGVAYAIFRH